VTYLRGRGPRFVTVCDRAGVKFVKISVYVRDEQRLISKDYNYTNTICEVLYQNEAHVEFFTKCDSLTIF